MKQLMLNSTIYKYDECKNFCREFRIGKDDLIITSKKIYDNYLKYNVNEAAILFKENYGSGEPTDEMVEAMYENIKRVSYERVIAIGGGSILDIGKIFSLRNIYPIRDLQEYKLEIIKDKELILVPTTCGTGSEINNVSILELKESKRKIQLSTDEFYADSAIIIPELLQSLPFETFVYSSTVVLNHAIESYLSTKATAYTKLFSLKAIDIIINGYKRIIEKGIGAKEEILNDFLLASNYSGIAHANVGCSEVLTIVCNVSSEYNISYGKASYIMLAKIFKAYQKANTNGEIKELNKFFANLLNCTEDEICKQVEGLLDSLTNKKLSTKYKIGEVEFNQLIILLKAKR